MAERVPKIPQSARPVFDASTYSDRLQETRQAPGALGPVQVFDKTKPASIVGLSQYVIGKLTDTVNALTDFTAAHQVRLDAGEAHDRTQDQRLNALEAKPFPFGSGSG